MQDWMILTIIYGIISGFCFIFQKKAMKTNHSIEVLTTYITISFIIVFIDVGNVITIDPKYLGLIALKSLVIFISWLLAFKAISKLSVSLYGVINMSRILFTTLLGIVILNECLSKNQMIGMLIICIGLLLVNIFKDDNKKNDKKYVIVLLIACIFTAIGGILDKIIAMHVEPNELQWWFLLFLFIFNWIYILGRKIKINFKKTFKNPWIYLNSFAFVVGDRILFTANAIPNSQVAIMSLLKQMSVIILVIVGGNMFKEKNLKCKFVCSLIILLGIVVITFY